MASLAEVRALQDVQDDVNAVATKTYVELLREFTGTPATQGAQAFVDVLFWDIISPATAQIDALAAQFYLEDREAQGVLTPPPPVPDLEVDERRVQSFAGWVRSLLDPGNDPDRTVFGFQEAVSKGSGGLQRQLFDRQRLMTLELGAAETDQTYYMRVARPGCCAFCAMLASRGAVYASLDAATKVVGRGVPIPRDANGDRIKKSGGQAGGIKTRGKRLVGDSYHDCCRCLGIAQHGDNAQELDDLAKKWFEIYAAARDSAKAKFDYSSEQWATWDASGDRAMHSRTFWVDDRKDSKTYGEELAYDAVQKQITADMRRIAAESYDLALA